MAEAQKIWIEAWAPEYGSSFEASDALAATEEEVDTAVEIDEWEAIVPGPTPWRTSAFLDGVSRVDARAFMAAGKVTVPGLCGSVGVGAVIVDGKANYGPLEVHRTAVFGAGASATIPPIDTALDYESRSVQGSRPEELRMGIENLRSEHEDEMARRLAGEGYLVIADGPARIREKLEVVGFIKSHQKTYLNPDLDQVVADLPAGGRTPLFHFGAIRPRYSWYQRLAPRGDQHPWAAIARCEVTAALSLKKAVALADLLTFHLPRFGSKAHWDTRAPQNLIPIAQLERRLRHLLGDRELVYRKIRSALAGG
ncbi:MAG TPA: hypothetical protein VI541_02025 [Actinomycetota bacterium]|nr:hypothetical protein [Actinomycetota bacterium]